MSKTVYLVNLQTWGHIRLKNAPPVVLDMLRAHGYRVATREEYYAVQRRMAAARMSRAAMRRWDAQMRSMP